MTEHNTWLLPSLPSGAPEHLAERRQSIESGLKGVRSIGSEVVEVRSAAFFRYAEARRRMGV